MRHNRLTVVPYVVSRSDVLLQQCLKFSEDRSLEYTKRFAYCQGHPFLPQSSSGAYQKIETTNARVALTKRKIIITTIIITIIALIILVITAI